jgi:hypothetical protein
LVALEEVVLGAVAVAEAGKSLALAIGISLGKGEF